MSERGKLLSDGEPFKLERGKRKAMKGKTISNGTNKHTRTKLRRWKGSHAQLHDQKLAQFEISRSLSNKRWKGVAIGGRELEADGDGFLEGRSGRVADSRVGRGDVRY